MSEALSVDAFSELPVRVVVLVQRHDMHVANPILPVVQRDRHIARSKQRAQTLDQGEPRPDFGDAFVDQSNQLGEDLDDSPGWLFAPR
ncbi:hypothetical protein D3C80_1900370 [compost metagenome]